MAATLRFFGTAAYELVTEAGTRVLIDPYMDSNPACPVKVAELDKVDLVLVTHNAYDHVGEAADILKRDGCPVICAKDVAHSLTTVKRESRPVSGTHHLGHPDGGRQGARASRGEPPLVLLGDALGRAALGAGHGLHGRCCARRAALPPGRSAMTYDFRLFGELYHPTHGLMVVALPEDLSPPLRSATEAAR